MPILSPLVGIFSQTPTFRKGCAAVSRSILTIARHSTMAGPRGTPIIPPTEKRIATCPMQEFTDSQFSRVDTRRGPRSNTGYLYYWRRVVRDDCRQGPA